MPTTNFAVLTSSCSLLCQKIHPEVKKNLKKYSIIMPILDFYNEKGKFALFIVLDKIISNHKLV